jgi:ATP-dependent DNA helicase RecG
MLRLIQGDVGAGKTVVAALAALQALEAGYQVALMAPTEILAEQHFITFKRWLEPLGIEVAWLAGKLKGKAAQRAGADRQRHADGGRHPRAVPGRGAVQEPGAGDHRRTAPLRRAATPGPAQKGVGGRMCPHQLIMTATPIPRTLAMSAYADLDTSILDELPPGRTPVNTVLVTDTRRVEVIERVRAPAPKGARPIGCAR